MASIFDNLGDAQNQSNHLGDEKEKKKFEKILFYTPVLGKDGEPLPLFRPKLGPNKFDILPWIAKTDLFGQKGKVVYDVCIDVNMNVGPKNAMVVSRAGLGYSDDPVQEEQFRLFNEGKAKGISKNSSKEEKKASKEWSNAVAMFPRKRSMYILNVYMEDGSKKPHLYTPAYNSFGKFLKEKEDFMRAQGKDVIWAHPTLGPTVYINGVNDPFPGDNGSMIDFTGFTGIEVLEREKAYPESIVERVPSLDEHLIIPSEDEVYTHLFGVKPPVAETEMKVEVEAEEPLAFSNPVTVTETIVEKVPEAKVEPTFEDDIPF